MKKLLFLAALVLAIGSYGGHINPAHAQTLTPAQTAALQQQLQVAKATLANLEMQAGAVPAGDNGMSTVAQPATTTQPAAGQLSQAEISSFQGTLNALATTLSQLNTSLATNSTLTPAQEQAVQSTLNGMQSTLVAMANTVSGSNTASGNVPPTVAGTPSQSTGLAQNTQPSNMATTPSVKTSPVAVASTTATTPAVTAQITPSTEAPQTAQASSLWSFTKSHWPTIAIILLILAILIILFWPEKEVVTTISTQSKQTHTTTTTTHNPVVQASAPAQTGTTPVSTVVGGSTQHQQSH